MNLSIETRRGKFYVVDSETGETLNKGKPFKSRDEAVRFMESQMSAQKLGEKKAMPKMDQMGEMAAMMAPGGAPSSMPLPPPQMPMSGPGMMGMLRGR